MNPALTLLIGLAILYLAATGRAEAVIRAFINPRKK